MPTPLHPRFERWQTLTISSLVLFFTMVAPPSIGIACEPIDLVSGEVHPTDPTEVEQVRAGLVARLVAAGAAPQPGSGVDPRDWQPVGYESPGEVAQREQVKEVMITHSIDPSQLSPTARPLTVLAYDVWLAEASIALEDSDEQALQGMAADLLEAFSHPNLTRLSQLMLWKMLSYLAAPTPSFDRLMFSGQFSSRVQAVIPNGRPDIAAATVFQILAAERLGERIVGREIAAHDVLLSHDSIVSDRVLGRMLADILLLAPESTLEEIDLVVAFSLDHSIEVTFRRSVAETLSDIIVGHVWGDSAAFDELLRRTPNPLERHLAVIRGTIRSTSLGSTLETASVSEPLEEGPEHSEFAYRTEDLRRFDPAALVLAALVAEYDQYLLDYVVLHASHLPASALRSFSEHVLPQHHPVRDVVLATLTADLQLDGGPPSIDPLSPQSPDRRREIALTMSATLVWPEFAPEMINALSSQDLADKISAIRYLSTLGGENSDLALMDCILDETTDSLIADMILEEKQAVGDVDFLQVLADNTLVAAEIRDRAASGIEFLLQQEVAVE